MHSRLHPRRQRLLLAALALTAAATAACGDDPSGPGSLGGPFALVMVDGDALPVAMAPGSPTRIEGGSLELHDGDSLRMTLRINGGGEIPLTVRYVRQGDSLVVAAPVGAGGVLVGREVRLRYGVPAPPSQGFGSYWHDFLFRR